MTLRGVGGGGSRLSVIMTLTVGNMICESPLTLGHCEIWRHFTRTLYFHSPSARDNTVATREICNS